MSLLILLLPMFLLLLVTPVSCRHVSVARVSYIACVPAIASFRKKINLADFVFVSSVFVEKFPTAEI